MSLTKDYPYQNRDLEDLPGEIWSDINGFEGYYQVSNLGRVKSVDRYVWHNSGVPLFRKGIIMSQAIGKDHNNFIGDDRLFLRVTFSKENIHYYLSVHRLVYEAFVSTIDHELIIIHIDGNGLNNTVDNLKMVTKTEKLQRMVNRGRHYIAKKTIDQNKFPELFERKSRHKKISQYDLNGKLIATYFSISEAIRQTGAVESTIIRSAKGKIKQPRKNIWKYE